MSKAASWPVLGVALLGSLLAACTGAPPPPGPPPSLQDLGLTLVADGLDSPLFATYRPGPGTLVIVEQGGLVWFWEGGRVEPPLLDLRDEVASGGERGLLGLAFQDSDTLVVDYTDNSGDTVVASYGVTCGHGRCTAQPLARILHIEQPYSNHNGGMVAFGPDGMLYVGMGDGGSGGDPQNHAQDLGSLLGKLLRIDVRATGACQEDTPCQAYTVPQDNPFVDRAGARGEVWAYGLRNPWRFSFDRETGDLWIGDVGQNRWEEVDFQPAASRGGENYGWSRFEGDHLYDASRSAPDAVAPVAEMGREGGACSLTGGYVYRGSALPALRGTYVFSDYCSGDMWGLRKGGEPFLLLESGLRVSSFGEDMAGEILVVGHGGSVHRIVQRDGQGQ